MQAPIDYQFTIDAEVLPNEWIEVDDDSLYAYPPAEVRGLCY